MVPVSQDLTTNRHLVPVKAHGPLRRAAITQQRPPIGIHDHSPLPVSDYPAVGILPLFADHMDLAMCYLSGSLVTPLPKASLAMSLRNLSMGLDHGQAALCSFQRTAPGE